MRLAVVGVVVTALMLAGGVAARPGEDRRSPDLVEGSSAGDGPLAEEAVQPPAGGSRTGDMGAAGSRNDRSGDQSVVGRPVRLVIPRIGLDEPVGDVGLDEEGQMRVPQNVQPAWYHHSPRPGEAGPAVMVGHVDFGGKVGSFQRLADLGARDLVLVEDEWGVRHEFFVDTVERFDKDDFPHDHVYGNTEAPELRLITCGGVFDTAEGSYRDNVVAFARAR